MAGKIHTLTPRGELKSSEEKRFSAESEIQQLIAAHLELLAGEQIDPENPLRWILIRREMPIGDWAVDHLLIDQYARPTLVEVKRGDNPDNRRKVVGQMLDYAATAAEVWSRDELRQAFEKMVKDRDDDPYDELREFLKLGNEMEGDDFAGNFWEMVSTSLEANRLRLLFVADDIPNELERVVKFLNEQTRDNLEVLAVEIKQYLGESGQALVPRVIGQSKSRVRPKNFSKKCMCGCNRDTGGRFYPGDDGPFKATLDRVSKGVFVIGDIDLSYAADRCRQDTALHCGSYTSHMIIELASKQAEHRQQD